MSWLRRGRFERLDDEAAPEGLRMNYRFALQIHAGVVLLAAALSNPCLAQSSMSRVTITHVRPEMLTEWVDLQKNEVVPALKKAGEKTRTVYVSGLFGSSYEYVIIAPIASFAQFDGDSPILKTLGPVPAARLGEKLRKCTVSSQSFLSTRLDDLSNVIEADQQPKILVSTRLRLVTGKLQEFETFMKTDVLPVYKKAKVGYLVSRRGLGANSNDFVLSTVYSKYADLDGGSVLTKALGPEGAAKVLAKLTGVANLVEQIVRSRVEDLSF
jgi:hypothetical protein